MWKYIERPRVNTHLIEGKQRLFTVAFVLTVELLAIGLVYLAIASLVYVVVFK